MSSIIYATLVGYVSWIIFVLLIIGYTAGVKKYKRVPENASLIIMLIGAGVALLVFTGVMIWHVFS